MSMVVFAQVTHGSKERIGIPRHGIHYSVPMALIRPPADIHVLHVHEKQAARGFFSIID